jgi:hypothetical protein
MTPDFDDDDRAERKPDTLYLENDDSEDIEIPSRYVVCGTCDGRGQHSHRFGAIPMADFMGPEWDDESREDYIAGRYDEQCGTCKGRRVVLVVDVDRCTPEQRKLVEEDAEAAAESAAEEASERRMMDWIETRGW